MTIQNEADYHLGMTRLESLDSTNPANLAEMEALGNALEAYEDRQGYMPLPPPVPSPRIQLAAQGAHGPGRDSRTDHLRPVIDFLLAKGNRPAQWWHADGWRSDPGGELHYAFTDPIDAAELREHFAFPPSIVLDDAGTIRDRVNRVNIYHQQSTRQFSFEVPQTDS